MIADEVEVIVYSDGTRFEFGPEWVKVTPSPTMPPELRAQLVEGLNRIYAEAVAS
jgi:hypothetical protein